MKMALRATTFAAFLLGVLPCSLAAQSSSHAAEGMQAMEHKPAVPSRDLALTGPTGTGKVITAANLKAMPHTSVTVTNGHTHQPETYSGVSLLAVMKLVPVTTGDSKPQPLTTVIVAQGTDDYRIVLSLCDADPGCRKGEAIVADSMNGQPLTTDGLFKLILSEDMIPRRWVRNLSSLTEQIVEP